MRSYDPGSMNFAFPKKKKIFQMSWDTIAACLKNINRLVLIG